MTEDFNLGQPQGIAPTDVIIFVGQPQGIAPTDVIIFVGQPQGIAPTDVIIFVGQPQGIAPTDVIIFVGAYPCGRPFSKTKNGHYLGKRSNNGMVTR